MNKKLLILMPVLVLLVPFVYSFGNPSGYSTDSTDYMMYAQFNQSDSSTIQAAESGQAFWDEGNYYEVKTNRLYHPATINYDKSICANISKIGVAETHNYTAKISWRVEEPSDDGMNLRPFGSSGDDTCGWSTNLAWQLMEGPGAGIIDLNFNSIDTGANLVLYDNLTIIVVVDETNNQANCTVYRETNNSGVFVITETGSVGMQNFINSKTATYNVIMGHSYRVSPPEQYWDDLVIWEVTDMDDALVRPSPPLDSTPPVFVDAGCKSCNPYQNYLNIPWITDDTTPTYNLTTDGIDTCAVMGNETGINDYNYTDMIANGGVECTTTGATQHICTIQESNKFTLGSAKNVSFGCKDALGNEAGNAIYSAPMGIYTFGTQCVSDCIKVTTGCSTYLEGGCTTIR